MRLVHTDCNGDTVEVSIGYSFDHKGRAVEVIWCPEPHKPSSSGKVTTSDIETGESNIEYFAQVYDMKWIEREDQGWVSPEDQLISILELYEDIKDDDISILDLANVVDLVGQITFAELVDFPAEHSITIRKWLSENPTPAMLKRQSS